MGVEKAEHGLYAPCLPEITASGNYEAQRQLDYRLVENEQLRVTPPASDASSAQAQGPQLRR
jgi:hypothetical protein